MRMFRLAFVMLTLLVLPTLFSQAQNNKVLKYDFGTGVFTGRLPFDQPFNIHVTHIGADVNSIYLVIEEIKKSNYRKLRKEKGRDTLTDDDLRIASGEPVFLSKVLWRGHDFLNDSATIVVKAFLTPNSEYILNVRGGKNVPISPEEKDRISTAVGESEAFQQLISNEAYANIVDENRLNNKLGNFSTEITSIANNVAQSIDPKYTVAGADYEAQYKALALTFHNFRQFATTINDAKGAAYTRIKVNAESRLKQLRADSTQVQKDIDAGPDSATLAQKRQLKRELDDSIKEEVKISREAERNRLYYRNPNAGTYKRNKAFYDQLKAVNWAALQPGSEAYDNLVDVIRQELDANNYGLLADDTKASINETAEKAVDQIETVLLLAIDEKDDIIEALLLKIEDVTFAQSQINPTYPSEVQDQIKLHVTLDLGYAYVANIDRTNLYAGMNIYFRGIDTSLPLKNYRRSFTDFIGSRTSLLVGISLQSIAKDSVRKGIIDNKMALVTGLGFRLLPWFKINGGAYLYYKFPTNPLENKTKLSFTGSPFVSLSIDFNLSSFLSSFGNGKVAQIFTP